MAPRSRRTPRSTPTGARSGSLWKWTGWSQTPNRSMPRRMRCRPKVTYLPRVSGFPRHLPTGRVAGHDPGSGSRGDQDRGTAGAGRPGQGCGSASAKERAEAGESVIGRIPAGPHRLAEALAHLDREVARQQARASCRDHRGGEEADGRTTGTCRGTLERDRGRRAVEAALVAEDANTSPASCRRSQARKLPRTVANITDPSSRLMPTRRVSCRATTPRWP